jgi:periplasmic protein CpxP/Spy
MIITAKNKSKAFLLIIAILLIANISLLAFFLQKRESNDYGTRADRKAFISNFLKKEIGFNQSQLLQYDTLSNRHREKMSTFFENMKNNKNEQFKQLVTSNFSDTTINKLAEQSTVSQKIMEVQLFNHIKSIRSLCTQGQLPAFDSLFSKVFNRRGDGRKKMVK